MDVGVVGDDVVVGDGGLVGEMASCRETPVKVSMNS